MNYHRLNFFFSQFASLPFGHSSAILALGLSTLYFHSEGFQYDFRKSICQCVCHELLWSKCRIIDPNSHKQAQQPLEKTTSRSLDILPLRVPSLKDSGSAELLHVRTEIGAVPDFTHSELGEAEQP